jgi:iron-sulfur cluster repair protein YtfE (RIC family)
MALNMLILHKTIYGKFNVFIDKTMFDMVFILCIGQIIQSYKQQQQKDILWQATSKKSTLKYLLLKYHATILHTLNDLTDLYNKFKC